MPTVTSENLQEFIQKELARKSQPNKSHISTTFPETQGSELVESHKERTFPGAFQRNKEMIRTMRTQGAGWKEQPTIYYDAEMNTPPKDRTKWKHAVTPISHEKHGHKHVVLSQDKSGYSVHHYSKEHKK